LWWKPLDDLAATPRKLTVGVGEYAEPNASSDGTRLVATLFDSRQFLIRVPTDVEIAADRAIAITDNQAGDITPAVSPDGGRLVFQFHTIGKPESLDRACGRHRRTPAHVRRRDGRLAGVFARRQGKSPSSPTEEASGGIWSISAEGGSPRLLVNALVLDTISWSPRWTTDRLRHAGRCGTAAVRGERGDGCGDAASDARSCIGTGMVAGARSHRVHRSPAGCERADDGACPVRRRRRSRPADSVADPPNIGTSLLAWDPRGRFLAVGGNSGSAQSVAWIVEARQGGSDSQKRGIPIRHANPGTRVSSDGKSLIIGVKDGTATSC
jgi:hypothetical protein